MKFCQKAKLDTLSPVELLQKLLVPNHILGEVAMDFIEELPLSHGKKYNFGGGGLP